MNDTNIKSDEIQKNLAHYRQVIGYMSANVPLGVLCLPKKLEKVLSSDGCIRVYDLINRDLTEIKGIGEKSISLLTSRLDEFFTIGI